MNADRTDLSRRTFIKTTSALVGAAGVFGVPAPARAFGANQRIRIGFIGPGGRGFGAHVQTLARLRKAGANVDLAAVSDVYSVQQDKVVDFILSNTGFKSKRYENYEDLLADKEIDAVCIATP
ncbi:MAG: Gfo/Idh/MocA family oxidoreductase, partial [Thermoguttaceae bacterium]